MDICRTILFILLLFKNYEGLGDVGEAGVAEAKAAKSVHDAWMQLGNTAKAKNILHDDNGKQISPGDVARLYRGNNINGNGASGMRPKHMHKGVDARDYNGALRQISHEMVAIARASQSRIDFLQGRLSAATDSHEELQWANQLLEAKDKNNFILGHLNDAMNHQHKAWQAREISRGNNNGGDRGHEAMMNTLKTNVMGLHYAYVEEFGQTAVSGRQFEAFANDADANAAITAITAEATTAVKVSERNTFVSLTSKPAKRTTSAWGNFGNGGKGPGGGNAGGNAGSGTGGGGPTWNASNPTTRPASGSTTPAGSGQSTNANRSATSRAADPIQRRPHKRPERKLNPRKILKFTISRERLQRTRAKLERMTRNAKLRFDRGKYGCDKKIENQLMKQIRQKNVSGRVQKFLHRSLRLLSSREDGKSKKNSLIKF